MSMGPSDIVGPHPYGGEATGQTLSAEVRARLEQEPLCIVKWLIENNPANLSDLGEVASKHMVYMLDDTETQHTTTWRCPADCHVNATTVSDPSRKDEQRDEPIIFYEAPSQVPAVPGQCIEEPSRRTKSE